MEEKWQGMAKYIVKNSGPLEGKVRISGAKNAVLPLMAASILAGEVAEIDDVPRLKDVDIMVEILKSLGAKVCQIDKNSLRIDSSKIVKEEVPLELSSKMRASFLVMGALLSKKGKAKVYMPGGCTIGARPIDLHIKGFEALGAKVIKGSNYVEAITPKEGLKGATIYLDFPSVGATENIMMAAVSAKGITYIENAAEEPEIVDLANLLNKMGAKIKGAGTDTIKIEGVKKLSSVKHRVIPDRIEAGTYMLAAAITRGNIIIENVLIDHIKPIIAKLRECGVDIENKDDGLHVKAVKDKIIYLENGAEVKGSNRLKATNIKTLPYPGFPTDIQSPFMAFLATVEGSSEVIETVFENRFMTVAELNKMGAQIITNGHSAKIIGIEKLVGAKVNSTDLRGGAAMVLAGLIAEGETEVLDIYHIERGYEDFTEKFASLGASITKVEED